MYHQIVLPYRARPRHLKLWLKSFGETLKKARLDTTITIVDLSPDHRETAKLIAQSDLHIQHLKVDYNGPSFPKAKAINHGVASGDAVWVSSFDVDCLVMPNWITFVERDIDNEAIQSRLVYRVHITNKNQCEDLELALLKLRVVGHPYRCPLDQLLRTPDGKLLGNSHFTMRKEKFLEVGGYDERFLGWNGEDREFMERVHHHLGEATLCPEARFYHLYHDHEPDWKQKKLEGANLLLLAKARSNQYPLPRITKEWGKFLSKEPS